MTLRDLWSNVKGWLPGGGGELCYAAVGDDGLISENISEVSVTPADRKRGGHIVKSPAGAVSRQDNTEVLGEAFGQLIGQLQGINEHLGKQVAQHEELMSRIEKLPDMIESLPDAVANQEKVVEALTEELKGRALKDRQFMDVIEKIPVETVKQSDALAEMSRKFSASADVSVQMGSNFNRFNETLEKLDKSTEGNTDGLKQMKKTFATSDRYLKYIVSKQQRRFMWVLAISLGICTLAIAGLVVAVMIMFKA